MDGKAGTLEPHAQDVGLSLLWMRAKYHSLLSSSLGGGTANHVTEAATGIATESPLLTMECPGHWYQSLRDAAVSETVDTNHTKISHH